MQNVGTRACGEAPPDGYTVCIINADPLVYNQFLLKNMPFDPEKVAQPVRNLYHLIQVLVVNASLEDEHDRRTHRAVEGESRHAELCHGGAAAGALHGYAQDNSTARTGCGCRSRAAARR